jgi:hypothetical protein
MTNKRPTPNKDQKSPQKNATPNTYGKENIKRPDVDTELENSDRARKARAGDEGYDIDQPQESSRRT